METTRLLPALALASLALTACGSDGDAPFAPPNERPSFIGSISTRTYDGTSDDLLTAGLGWDGLMLAAPTVSATPTAAELRKLAIYTNYRALVDITANGGYGRLYGPNVSLTGTIDSTPGAGKVAGTEYITTSLDATGKVAATLMVQVPASFNPASPCIVTATSSGSRGVYGAVSAAGEWGFKRGCAVAYTDKGSGNGGHDLTTNQVTLVDGTLTTAPLAGNNALFAATMTEAQRTAFIATNPARFAYKHAHSQTNPEKDWGLFTLQAVQFAFYVLNEQFSPTVPQGGAKERRISQTNTTTIAASVSNGGGASLMAAEQDAAGLISAVVVGEPQINLNLPAGLQVTRGGTPVSSIGRPLYDYVTVANLMQPCAAYAASNAASPLLALVNATFAQNRCAALAGAGLITGADFAAQANDALARLLAAGWEADSNLLHASHYGLQATTGVALTYANAYARASVLDNLCAFSMATTSAAGTPAVAAATPLINIFGVGNGVPPTNGINLIYNAAGGGAINHLLADNNFAFAGAQCLRGLWTGNAAVATSVNQLRLSGNVRGKPVLIVQGRNDALVPVNHTSRPYFGMNRIVEGSASKLSIIEIANAQHFDSFLSVAGYDTRFVPVHYYNIQALNMMWNTLKGGAPLPPSQVVRTTPRGGTPGAAPALTTANLPAIALSPAAGDQILFNATTTTVQVPN